ncbi:hypothetical protein FOZ62_005915 [Perkinsus olseni]|uniref:RRM domain-containing protein n=1 Tax=Perkinsus olseni TaxID=32597 RepID=A0A7J6R202_PEROL|nr:hypothetical protein FOZ62_005915 [Perkinsus olseni]
MPASITPASPPSTNNKVTTVRFHGVPGNASHDDIVEALASRGFHHAEEGGQYVSCEKIRKSDGAFDALVRCATREDADRLLKAFDCFRWPRANCLTHTSLVEVDGDAEDDDIADRTVLVTGLGNHYNNDRLKADMERAFGAVVGCVVGRSQPEAVKSGFCTFVSLASATMAVCTSKAAGMKVEEAVRKMRVFGDDAGIERYKASMGLQLMSHYMTGLLSKEKPKKPAGLLPTPKRRTPVKKKPPVISLEKALPPRQEAPLWVSAGPQEPPYLCLQRALGMPASVSSTADSSTRASPRQRGNPFHERLNRPRRSVEEIEASVPDCAQQ